MGNRKLRGALYKTQIVLHCEYRGHKVTRSRLDGAWCTSSRPVLVVTTSMSELPSSSVTVSRSSVGVAGLNWKGVLAPLMSPVCVT